MALSRLAARATSPAGRARDGGWCSCDHPRTEQFGDADAWAPSGRQGTSANSVHDQAVVQIPRMRLLDASAVSSEPRGVSQLRGRLPAGAKRTILQRSPRDPIPPSSDRGKPPLTDGGHNHGADRPGLRAHHGRAGYPAPLTATPTAAAQARSATRQLRMWSNAYSAASSSASRSFMLPIGARPGGKGVETSDSSGRSSLSLRSL